jgi:hypothetical protein
MIYLVIQSQKVAPSTFRSALVKDTSKPEGSPFQNKRPSDTKGPLGQDGDTLGTVTEDEGSDNNSFSSRASYLDKEYKVRVNDSEVESASQNKAEARGVSKQSSQAKGKC